MVTITLITLLGENEEIDKLFYEYLDMYSIIYYEEKNQDPLEPALYPTISYTGGPIALINMLTERFGYEKEEIQEEFPMLII
jgi:hypothetical protein